MLWIALFLPELPLQLAQRGGPIPGPCVIAEGPAARPVVCCVNQAARECGVLPAMPVAAARTLVHTLLVLQRSTAAERQALHNLACWACQFTPNVTLQSDQGLLCEVKSTLQLHGGLQPLLRRLTQEVEALGYRACLDVAPTPLAAWLLAKTQCSENPIRPSTHPCTDAALLRRQLDELPLTLFDWPREVVAPLHALGIQNIGQCLALPRAGLLQRFGAACQRDLDRALGTVADPRAWFTPPDTFASRTEFGFEVNDALALLFPLKRLLQELQGWLRGRGAGVQQWQLVLEHRRRDSTTLTIGTTTPEHDAERFVALARERLGQTTLAAPVLALGITADRLLAFEQHNHSLIPDTCSRAIGWAHLVDRLGARLGADKVHRLHALAGHRPEHTSARSVTLADSAPLHAHAMAVRTAPQPPRPLWLLDTPRALRADDKGPHCQGPLHLLAGPERIESGWWDGQSVRRDYYVARNAKGATLWIYRTHHDHAWYLHGVFA